MVKFLSVEVKPVNQNRALISGAAGGLGLATTQFLVAKGWHVFVADCNKTALEVFVDDQNITPVFLDVTQLDSVDHAFDEIKRQSSYLNAVINFAGILK